MLTIVTVTKPENAAELQACALALRNNERERNEWLIVTESQNVDAVSSIVPFETVTAMSELHPELEAIPSGYYRQMAAKMFAANLIPDGVIMFIDDDVIAMSQWSEDTFVDSNGMPIIYFQRARGHFWTFGQVAVFGNECGERLFQLKMPYVQTAESLHILINSDYGMRALQCWKDSIRLSEFCLFGEWEFRANTGGHTIRNRERSRDHWTIDRGIFKDWQRNRRGLRAAIASHQV